MENTEAKLKEVISTKPNSTKETEKVLMAEKLDDRVAYQRMCNQDLSIKGESRYKDQGIVFMADGKVLDEIK